MAKRRPKKKSLLLDRTNSRMLAGQIEEELIDLAKQHGLSIEMDRWTYDRGGQWVEYKLKVSRKEEGIAMTKEASAFKTSARFYGLHEDDLGCKFRSGNHTFKIVGLSPRSPKRPLLCEREDGKTFKFMANAVVMGLKRERE